MRTATNSVSPYSLRASIIMSRVGTPMASSTEDKIYHTSGAMPPGLSYKKEESIVTRLGR